MVDVVESNNHYSDIKLWVDNFLKKRHHSKYELKITGNGEKGSGFMGIITFISILTSVIGRNEEIVYNLVVKSRKKMNQEEQLMAHRLVYEREIFVYSKIFPAFEKYQKSKGILEPFNKYPKCYSVYENDEKEAIMLENLTKLNYELHDSAKPQNLHHIFTVIKNYAHFHALSIALQHDEPELYKKLTSNINDDFGVILGQSNLIDSVITLFDNAMDILKQDNTCHEVYKKLKHFENNGKTILCHQSKKSDILWGIIHGDCWNNNMMFLYKDDNKLVPHDMAFLDFQVTALNSPVRDLSHYLYSIGDEQTFQYIDRILEYYLYHFNDFLKQCQINDISLTLDQLKNEWIIYGKLPVVMAPAIIQVELNKMKDLLNDIDAETDNAMLESILTHSTELVNREFSNRTKAVFKHYASLL